MSPLSRSLAVCAALLACKPAPARPTAPATQRQTAGQLRGRVLGHDGRPLAFATISLRRPDRADPPRHTRLADDGAFTLDPGPAADLVMLAVDGVAHDPLYVTLDVRDPDLSLEIRLGARPGPRSGAQALVSPALVQPDGQLAPGEPTTIDLASAGDRVWTATVPTNQHGVLYRWMTPQSPPLPVPAGAAGYTAPFGQIWAHVPARDGQATLRIDASTLPATIVAPTITITGDAPATAALLAGWRAGLAWRDDAAADTCDRAAAEARKLDGPTAAPLWIAHAELAARRPCPIAPADARLALQKIRADDLRWVVAVPALRATLDALAVEDRAAADAYEAAVVDRHPNPHLAARLLLERLLAASAAGDKPRVRALVARLRVPRFAGTAGRIVATQYDDSVDVGKPTPDFSLPALDGGPPISRASLLGRPHVIDFWATWCGACVDKLPALHRAYAELLGVPAPADAAGWRGLALPGAPAVEFVSISMHEPASKVTAFRGERWPIPWPNAVAGDQSDAVAEQFGLGPLPTILFVDAAGVVVQKDGDLATGLRKLLAPPN